MRVVIVLAIDWYYNRPMFTLEPASVALIGASDEEKKLGHSILKNLKDSGYKSKIYPINPKHTELLGIPCFASIGAISEPIDLAVIVTPAATVCDLAQECGKKKVKTLVIISAGFSELATDEGKKRERELLSIAQHYSMSIVGPNCLGILRPSIGLNASFAATPSRFGNVALISQSGAMAVALLDTCEETGLGFSLVASIGNKADLDESDFLEICESDERTQAIGLYLESIKDGRRFVETAKRVSRKKPIVLIKSGNSLRGSMAVSSHTGALAGSTAALIAACRSAGIHRASTTEEFLDLLSVLSTQPPLLSRNIAVITNAGGPGVLATDRAESAGLTLVDLTEGTKSALRHVLPEAASVRNPVDVLGDARADRYGAALHACAEDPAIDGIVLVLTPQVMTPCEDIAKVIVESAWGHPLIPIVTCFMGGPHVQKARKILSEAGIPCLTTPEAAVQAMSALFKKETQVNPLEEKDAEDDRSSAASALLKNQTGLLSEELVDDLFALYGLPTPKGAVATHAKEALEIAQSIGYPVIAKISSPDILHKTDIGGIAVNLKNKKEVEQAYRDILASCVEHAPNAALRGILIQQFLPIGNEFIIGAIRDPNFGPLVMVGLGGIYTELFRDTCFALAPVTENQAYDMLSSLKSWKLLTGMRGKGALDIDALAKTICKISTLMTDCPTLCEIDLNPVLVAQDKIVIADAKVVVADRA